MARARKTRMPARATVVLAACLLASCSPYVYKQEIGAFNDGVTAIIASYESGRKSVGDAIAQDQQQAFISGRVKLDLLDGCDQVDPSGTPPRLPPCAVTKFPATKPPVQPPIETTLANAAPDFDALRNYAAALSAITNASDDAQLTAATQSLISSVDGLTTAAASLSSAPAPPQSVINASGSIIGRLVAVYLDTRRYDVLRNTVPAADTSIRTISQTVKAALLAIRAQQLLRLEKEMHAAEAPLQSDSVSKLSAAEYQSDLAILQAKVVMFNQLRAIDPQVAVGALVDAHHKLAQALQNDTRQAQPVYVATVNFLNAAAQLQSAVVSVSASSRPAGRGK
ncbi:MAG: hypothetical protein KGJ66_07170 [Alphaproteobacteria bacterium]|nr:hypothetical protein [Alphaproteobacteria bacterium]